MFRLQKALEKARDKRSEHFGLVNAKSTPLEDISYSETKVIRQEAEALESKRIIAGFSHDLRSQIFRTLRTQVIRHLKTNNWNTLGVTSPCAGDGKTTIACNLAVAMAMEVNQTVLLVDLNMRNAQIADYFNVHTEYGIADYLKGKVGMASIMVNPGIERLVLVPGSSGIDNPAELISSPQMAAFVQETKKRYKSRIIIYDLPAVLPTDDAMIAMQKLDASLLVIGDGRDAKDEIEKSCQLLSKHNLIGTVLNNVSHISSLT